MFSPFFVELWCLMSIHLYPVKSRKNRVFTILPMKNLIILFLLLHRALKIIILWHLHLILTKMSLMFCPFFNNKQSSTLCIVSVPVQSVSTFDMTIRHQSCKDIFLRIYQPWCNMHLSWPVMHVQSVGSNKHWCVKQSRNIYWRDLPLFSFIINILSCNVYPRVRLYLTYNGKLLIRYQCMLLST